MTSAVPNFRPLDSKPRFVTRIEDIPQLSDEEKAALQKVTDRFIFRANEYYLSLIDWNDPEDPIRRLIIPNPEELEPWGSIDPSYEEGYTVARGLEHKYDSVAVVLATSCCGGYCRFCFRKRIYMKGHRETARDMTETLRYIQTHREISEVLLTGGDPLVLSTPELDAIIRAIREVPHIRIVRIGSKMPAFYPYRISRDPELLEMFRKYSSRERKLYIMAHFNHPRELTPQALEAIGLLQRAGVQVVNQTPLIRGINDRPEVLVELFQRLSAAGVPPYYVFQCRPTVGNKPYAVPVEEGYGIFETAKSLCSGLAKRARFVMSHRWGKIEVVGLTDVEVIFKFHRAHEKKNCSRIMTFRRNSRAYWLDDYEELTGDHSLWNSL
ncbi:MAG: KamA family radical SAM protein [Nitrospinae bacterium CG11_big_fil_rev_8_21_14_0_20_56_8]|nr:MAG: KamA family radical SAM protein [Nitrospinae bacterium CG11_big_fil_rev_8_21_14_0_20_56_8]